MDPSESEKCLLLAKNKQSGMHSKFKHLFPEINSFSSMVVISWNLLICVYREFMIFFVSQLGRSVKLGFIFSTVLDSAIHFHLLFYPIGGAIADMWMGRYRTITISINICCTAWLLTVIGFLLWFLSNKQVVAVTVTVSIIICVILVGLAGFESNVISFNIDQITSASSDEVSMVIYWHLFSYHLPRLVAALVPWKLLSTTVAGVISLTVSGLSLLLILISKSLFKHQLDTTHQKTNPIQLIFHVLNYARKNRYPQSRSALTYWENKSPSRIDLGKDRFGGPFSEEQVENVKTVLRIVPLFIAIIGCFLAWDSVKLTELSAPGVVGNNLFAYYMDQHVIPLTTRLTLILLYQFIFRQYCYKFIPTMLNRISMGLALALMTSLSYLLIAIAGELKEPHSECPLNYYAGHNASFTLPVSYQWLLIPQAVYGVSIFMVTVTSVEFTIAQSPTQMMGLMVGLWYATYGLGEIVTKNLFWPFSTIHGQYFSNCTCLCYYYICCCVAIGLVLAVFGYCSRHYRFRIRDYTVPIYQLAEEHTARYLRGYG